MSRYTIEQVKSRKNFYRNHFRATVRVLVGSLLLNMVWLLALVYQEVTRPEPKFYATDSASFIKPLESFNAPNMSSEYLLPPSEPQEIWAKNIEGSNVEQNQNQPEEVENVESPINSENANVIIKNEEENSP